ncbi:Leukocyte elastase inhibitor [Alteripontixanthobacter maritimus]|uniref:Leukocyte elastase inhibitor n=1 Tax=Alteripontixanthobacter maritimus TaxID=2161824 RepID=A0A369QEU4_9SPHN|nr:serpin family protein [Alteripontixanthobacter maritimus]RDC60818.1 Leukocyte elastase inhibitor [Alteripontixanthobacter maritimus]
MRKILTSCVAVLALAACTQNAPAQPTPAPSETDEVQAARPTGPLAVYTVLADAAAADENIVYSPTSAAQAFGLVHLGARGETAAQIEQTFALPAGAKGDAQLGHRRTALSDPGVGVKLRIANALFLADNYRLRDRYVADAKAIYGATTDTVNFKLRPAAAARTINAWADRETNGLIPQVVTPQSIVRDAAAYLANATYFEGDWSRAFTQVERAPFLFGNGRETTFDLMKAEADYATVIDNGWRAVRMPYGRMRRFVMDIMLPEERTAKLPELGVARIAKLDSQLTKAKPASTRLWLPRFEADMEQDLIAPLRRLGLTLPFDRAAADLTGMSHPASARLYIEKAFQVAKLQVFQTGTKAAAATIAVAVPVSVPPPFTGREFRVDQPFLFAIRDTQTGEILFFGRIASPDPYSG